MLTKLDIAAFRKADTLCVHLDAHNPEGLVRLIKRGDRNKDPFAQDVEHIVSCEVTVPVRRNLDTGAKCFGYVDFYHSQLTETSCVIRTLRAGDEITFRFWPDCNSNDYVRRAGLHADAMFLDVKRQGKRVACWKLESSICPDNSARMCQGFVDRDVVAA